MADKIPNLGNIKVDGVNIGQITIEQFGEAVKDNDKIKSRVDSFYRVLADDGYTIEVEITAGENAMGLDDLSVYMKSENGGIARIHPGVYMFVPAFRYEVGEWTDLIDGLVFAIDDKSSVELEDMHFERISLRNKPDGDEMGVKWAIRSNETGDLVMYKDVMTSLVLKASFLIIAEKLGVNTENKPLILPGGKVFSSSMKGKPKKKNITKINSNFVADMGALAISAENIKSLEAAITSSKTFAQLNGLAMESGYKYSSDKVCRVETTVSQLLTDRGIDSKNKKARAKIRNEVKSLGDEIRWTFEKKNGDFITIPLAGGAYYAKGDRVSFAFSAEYMALIASRTAGRMPMPKALLTTDEKNNPCSFSIGVKLCMHTYQNLGKQNENTLSVSKLLESTNDIPSYEEVESTDRAYTRRIIKPMERDLNHLVEIGVLDYWDYCHTKGEPLTDEEQAARLDEEGNETALPYTIAINCNIQWKLVEEFPEHREKTLESREKRRLDAIAAKQRDEEKQKRFERKKETYMAKAAAKKEVEN